MKISGLQKLTLLDYSGQTACTVFLSGCNFQCPFCHNSSLIGAQGEEFISAEEFFRFLDKRTRVLDGVCVSGGEPLLCSDTVDFIKRIKEKGFKVKLDTNGSFPDRLEELIEGGLIDYCAMDIKNSQEKYALTAGVPDLDISQILKSVEILKRGKIEYEFRTTVARELHCGEDFEKIGLWLNGADKYYLQKYRETDNVLKKGFTPYSDEEMQSFLDIIGDKVKHKGLRG